MPLRDDCPAPPVELDPFTLRRAGQGDTRAFRVLIELYQGRVRALVTRMLLRRPRQDVEDVAQECFLRVFRALPRFDPEGSARLSTWILTIATRLAIDELRRKRPEVSARPVDTRALAADGADAGLRQARLREAVEAALASLNPPQRAAFVLHVFHALSYQQIADSLELELGTVKSRIARARVALRIELKELQPDV